MAWQRQFHVPAFSNSVPAGQLSTTDAIAPALLAGDTLYFAYQTIVSNAFPVLRFKIIARLEGWEDAPERGVMFAIGALLGVERPAENG